MQEEIQEAYLAKQVRAVRADMHLGDPLAAGTTMGLLNSEAMAAKMDGRITGAVERGAREVLGADGGSARRQCCITGRPCLAA